MASNASAVLGVIGRDLFGLQNATKALASDLGLVKVAAVGAMTAIAGGAALRGMWSLVDAGRELVHQQALMRSAGMSSAEIAAATAKSWQVTRDVMGSKVDENAKAVRELRMVFGDTNEAIANLPMFTQAQRIVRSLLGNEKADQVFDLAKAEEIKGVSMDPEHFAKLADAATRAAVASGGRVTFADFLSAAKFGRTATQGWDDDFWGSVLPVLMQEMKGGGGFGGASGPGNALMTAFSAVVGGTMSNKAANEFAKLNLVDPDKVIRTSTGSVKGVAPGGIAGSAEFQANPYQWTQDFLMPALKAAGITSPDAIREEVAHLFANRTAQQMITMFATQQARFAKERELIGGAQGLDAINNMEATDPTTKMAAFTDAWHNLMVALGGPMVDPSMGMMGRMTVALNDFSAWAAAHPETVGNLEVIAAGLAAVGVALGAFAVGAAGAAALGVLAGPIGLAALAVGLIAFGNAFKGIPSWLIDMARGAAIGAVAGSVVPVIGTAAGAAAGAVAGLGYNAVDGLSPDINQAISDSYSGFPSVNYVPPPPTAAANDKGPMPVVVVNPGDIARGTTSYQADQASRPPTGPTQPSVRFTPAYPSAYGG